MKMMRLGNTDLQVSRIALGCMRLSDDPATAMASVRAALDQGITMFDHADIYGRGARETMFSGIWSQIPGLREKIVIQSKCGICSAGSPKPTSPTRYDFSREHILRSVEKSLKRLKTDHLDVLLLHRPDLLVAPAEVASAFDELHSSGKVRYFGVSNHTGAQIALLQRTVRQPIVANQLLVSVVDSELLEVGIGLSRRPVLRRIRGDGTLEFCQMSDITIQAWGPMAGGAVSGNLPAEPDDRISATARLVAELADAKGISREAIVIAFLLRHPAGIQPIIGTTNPVRIAGACQATEIDLTHEEWYRLFVAGRGEGMP